MKPRGDRARIHCLSRGLELRLKKADRGRGRQADRLEVEDGRAEYEKVREGDG